MLLEQYHKRESDMLNIVTGTACVEDHHSSDNICYNSSPSYDIAFVQQFCKLHLIDSNKQKQIRTCLSFNHMFGSASTNSSATGLVQDCC